nr:DUF6465 family protein [uncultured Blautia sp.]
MSVRKTTTKAAKATTAADVKTTPVKTEEIKTETVSTKKAPVKRAAAKKAATTVKKAEVKEAVYIQFAGSEYNLDEIRANVKKAWTEETGNKESDIKEVQIYVKPEEHAAYYVVNQEVVEGGRKIGL